MKTIFYSWMSDHPNKTNRGFIRDALEKAAGELFKHGVVDEAPRVDHDTKETAGSPDIFGTICRKIDSSDAYLADISLMPRPEGTRPMPNPNVLLELGYAWRTLGEDRIILVMNTAHGEPRALPFNFGFRRIITYRLVAEAEDKADVRRVLVSTFKAGLEAIHSKAREAETDEARSRWLAELAVVLVEMLPQLEQFDRHYGGSRHSNMIHAANDWGSRLRFLAVSEESEHGSLIRELAEKSEKLSSEVRHASSGSNELEMARQLLALALRARDEILDGVALDEESRRTIAEAIRNAQTELAVLLDRVDEGAFEFQIERMFTEAADVGDGLVRFAYLDLSSLNIDREKLQGLAHELALMRHEQLVMDGGRTVRNAEERIRDAAKRLENFVDSLK